MYSQEIIDEVVRRLKRSDLKHEIRTYLVSKNIPAEEIDDLIKLAEEQLGLKRSKIRITIFFVSLILLMEVIHIFYFVLPFENDTENHVIHSFIGGYSFSFLFLCVVFFIGIKKFVGRKSYDFFNIGNTFGVITLVSFLPAFIIYFILMARFEYGENLILQKTQVETFGVVVGGKREGFTSFLDSRIRVKFKVKESGKEIVVYERLDDEELYEYILGRTVRMIYSSDNPQNIAVLVDESEIKYFKNSKEWNVHPEDLLDILYMSKDKISPFLNKISYGWVYKKKDQLYANKEKGMTIRVSKNQVVFMIDQNNVQLYSEALEEMEFIQINKVKNKQKKFVFNNFTATVSEKLLKGKKWTMLIMRKK